VARAATPPVRERRTRQLEATYRVVHTAHDHPTAEQVHARVRRRIKRISLGTVYRNLQKLAAQGRVRVVHLGPRSTRFDAMLDPHQHFMCEACGAITDLPSEAPASAHPAALQRGGYRVTRQTTTFFGVCPNCCPPSRRG